MIKKIIFKIISKKRIEFLRSNPFFTNGKFRDIIVDIQKYININDKSIGNEPETSVLLSRKFAHIIDKGLHRPDVQAGHSKSIELALNENLNCINSNNYLKDESIIWAEEKHKLYLNLQESKSIAELAENPENPEINFDSFLKFIKNRRSNRQFSSDLVSDEILLKLAETINWAASSCNKQPNKIFITNNPNLASECLKQCKGGTGFSREIPCFVSFCVDMRGYYLPHEMYLPHIDASLGAQNFYLALQTFNLSGTSLSWALKDDKEERKLRELLNIPDYYQIIFNSVIGYASKNYITPSRKSINSSISIIK